MGSNKQLTTNVLGMLVVKALAMLISLAIIPYYLIYFNNNEKLLGEWLAFFSILMIFLTLDFGVGSKLKNDLIVTSNDNQYGLIIKGVLANSIVSLFIIIFAYLAINLFSLIKTASIGNNDTFGNDIIFIGVFFILLMSPLKIIIPILQSQQKNWISALILVTPQIYIFLYLFIKISYSEASSFLELILVLSISTIVTYIILAIKLTNKVPSNNSVFLLNYEMLISTFRYIRSSLSFFAAQVSMIILFSTNEVFYSLIDQNEKVVHYQYYYRIFSIIFVGFSSMSMPFWSAMRKSYSLNDNKKTNKLFLILCSLLLPALMTIIIISFNFQTILDLWLGEEKYLLNTSSILLFSILSFLMCVMYACSALLNSLGILKFQAVIFILACIIKFFFAYFLINSDFDPVLISTVISLLFISICFIYKTSKALYSINHRS